MVVAASQVKELREATGLGMMLCKKALTEAEGDMQKAIENLRKQGQATAQKRAGKAAHEGRVSVCIKDNIGLIYEVNSETDFVARNDDFVSFTSELGALLCENTPQNMASALSLTSDRWDGKSVEARLTELMGKIGEKITFRRFQIIRIDPARQHIHSYVHGEGKIGVIVTLSVEKQETVEGESVAELGKQMAMQVAAANPAGINRDSIPRDIVSKEREIYLTQAQSSGRPQKVWDKIVEGKMAKYYKEHVLLEQEYIRDTDISVADRIEQTEKETGAKIEVDSFIRYALGEEQ